jgi:flagellar basal-body rod modification protein FlgD
MTSIASAAATASSTSAPSSTAAASTAIGGDFNTFLKMLTTQLQNQDPTNAMDPTQMTNQLVSFAQVEQQISMNTNLTSLISLQQSQSLTSSANLVGRTVELSGTTLPLQSGEAQLRLPAKGTATAAQVQVVDTNGAVLRTQTVRLGSAATNWTWDGKTDDGRQLPDGAYTYSVNGIGPGGAALPLTATVLGTATGVQRQNNVLNLMFGPTGLGMDKVVSVD